MTRISFTILGNQEKPEGNPIPYFRTTQGGQWKPGARRYHAWKDHVRACFMDAAKRQVSPALLKTYETSLFMLKKPIPSGVGEGKPKMEIRILWANKAHADCSNVFKGIEDALFVNDKQVFGGFDYEYSPEKRGSVAITLDI